MPARLAAALALLLLPCAASADPALQETPRGPALILPSDQLFAFGEIELRPGADAALAEALEVIRQHSPQRVAVVGHTDSVGANATNDELSRRRAETVRHWLSRQGEPLPPIAAEGRGEREPLAPNTVADRDNPSGRERNRRVEVVLVN